MRKLSLLIVQLILLVTIGYTQSVKIGNQVWMKKNLNVDKFRNGDPIPQAKTDEEWEKAGENKQPAWCYYDNNTANGEKYGKLYNWYAVTDPRGLAPLGYHVPTDTEWTILTDYLGGTDLAGKKMRRTRGWSGLPGGGRDYDGTFYDVGGNGGWWSSTEGGTNSAWCRYLDYSNGDVDGDDYDKTAGLSVRCIRD